MNEAVKWSLESWKQRHEAGYFPNSVQHRDWLIYDAPPEWLVKLGCPVPSDDVLEVGCGYGEWMIPLSPMVKSVCGFDIHPSVIDMAGRKFAKHGASNCSAVVNDGLTIPYEDGRFDLVYSISVFQHLPRAIVHGYIAEIARVLKPNGRALMHFRNADNVGPYPPLADDIAANHTGDFSVGWTADQVREACLESFNAVNVFDIGLFLVARAWN
jgi:ubiquinone/menaquinone biosynthesis C-methylase UbiE